MAKMLYVELEDEEWEILIERPFFNYLYNKKAIETKMNNKGTKIVVPNLKYFGSMLDDMVRFHLSETEENLMEALKLIKQNA